MVFAWLITCQAQSEEDVKPADGLVYRAVQEAKAQGKTKAVLGVPIPLPTSLRNVDDVLDHYSILITEHAQAPVTVVEQNGIDTWHRLRIREVILRQRETNDEPLPDDLPSQLLPVPQGEVLAATSGGTTIIDGIIVTQGSHWGISLRPGNQYLLFVWLTSGGRHAQLAANEASVFLIHADGTFEPVSKLRSPLIEDVQAFSGNILSQFRKAVRTRRPDRVTADGVH